MTGSGSSLMSALEAEVGSVMGVEASSEQLDLLRDEETGRLPANVFRIARRDRGPGRPKGSGNKKTEQIAKLIVQECGDPLLGAARIAAKPLDELCELLKIADGSQAREDRLFLALDNIEKAATNLIRGQKDKPLTEKQLERLEAMTRHAADMARSIKAKPGELGLKALGLQLQARRDVAPYVHGKKPLEVDLNIRPDVILNIPGLTDPAHLTTLTSSPELTEEDLQRLEYLPETGDRECADGADDED